MFSDLERPGEKLTNIMYQGGAATRFSLVKKQFDIIINNYKAGKLNNDKKDPMGYDQIQEHECVHDGNKSNQIQNVGN